MMETKYDLNDRTRKFGKSIIVLSSSISRNPVTSPLISQLVRSGTSIGANYAEANGASSPADFRNKIFLCKKEGQETDYWLEMLADATSDKENLETIQTECKELIYIFNKILKTMNEKYGNRSTH